MPRGLSENTRAIVLRRVAYREADWILTLLTESQGRVDVIAASARRSKRRFPGALEGFAVIDAQITLGRGELHRLGQARLSRNFPGLLSNLIAMGYAAEGAELIRELVAPHEPDIRLSILLEALFECLSDACQGPRVIDGEGAKHSMRCFRLRLLSIVGLYPNLDRCGRCDRLAPLRRAAFFDPSLGAIVCRACGGGPLILNGDHRLFARSIAELNDDAPEVTLSLLRAPALRPEGQPLACDALDEAVSAFIVANLDRPPRTSSLSAQFRELPDARSHHFDCPPADGGPEPKDE